MSRRALAALLPLLLAAAGSDLAFKDRGNRTEGVMTRTNVSGHTFGLVALHLEPEVPVGRSDALYLWVPRVAEGTEVEVYIREPGSNYVMSPKAGAPDGDCQQRRFRAGEWFCWPRDVLDELVSDCSRLQLDASVDSGEIRLPTLLTDRPETARAKGYVFVLETSDDLEGEWQILSEDGETLVSSPIADYDEGTIRLRWDGRTNEKEPVPPGTYLFAFEGTLLGERMRPVALEARFLHDVPETMR